MTLRTKPSVYNVAEAKAHLPELVERASAGETIIVARAIVTRDALVTAHAVPSVWAQGCKNGHSASRGGVV